MAGHLTDGGRDDDAGDRTLGRALGAGGEGDVIRVMNISSRATLMARVNADGSVTVAQR